MRAPLAKLAENYRRRGILILISDFYEEPAGFATPYGACAIAATT